MGIATFADNDKGGHDRAYRHSGRGMLLIADPGSRDPFEAAVSLVGGRLLQQIPWSAAATTLPQIAGRPVLVIEATGVDSAILDAVLPLLAEHIAAAAQPSVIAIGKGQIDLVARHLLGARVDLLCEPQAFERVAALVAASRPVEISLHNSVPTNVRTDRSGFHAEGRETDDERFKRLSDSMARISRIAADFLRPDAVATPVDLSDRRSAYGSEPVQPAHAVRPNEVRRLIRRRRSRSKFFGQFGGEALFEDPAWDMLLDLFAAELEGTQVSVSSLCIAAGVAPTTALRWIAKMTEMELFIRHPDPVDRRRAFMTLSPRASDAMRGYMMDIRKI